MTDAIDLTTEQRHTLSTLLGRFIPGIAVWAYGSRVRWTARPNSDLDLVAFTTPAQRRQVSDLKDALAESNLPFPVDLHVWDDVPERFREIIRQEYVVVQEAKELERKTGIPEEWQRYEVSKLLAKGKLVVGDGYRAKNSELSRTGLPFARAGNINNGFQFAEADHFPSDALSRVGNKVSQPGDVVFTSKGTVGRFAFVRENTQRFVYSPQLCFWRSLDQALIQSRFLYYWMHGSEFFAQFKGVAGQTDMAEYVSLTDQRRMHLTLPNVSEQRAIAHILGTLDDKIELNRRMNETLEAMARALFKSWFVDFDPVRAKAEGRDPGLPKHVADLFPARLVDSELGEIPEGWEVGKVSDLCEAIFSGGTPSTTKAEYWDGDIPWLSSGETREKFITNTERRISAEGVANSSTRLAPAFATVIASAGQGNTRGQTSLLTFESYVNQSVVALTANKNRSSALHLFFDLERRYEEFRRVSDAHSSRGSLTTKLLASLSAVLAPKTVVGCFETVAMPLVRAATANMVESRTLASLRDTLLPKLISGELRLPDTARIVARC